MIDTAKTFGNLCCFPVHWLDHSIHFSMCRPEWTIQVLVPSPTSFYWRVTAALFQSLFQCSWFMWILINRKVEVFVWHLMLCPDCPDMACMYTMCSGTCWWQNQDAGPLLTEGKHQECPQDVNHTRGFCKFQTYSYWPLDFSSFLCSGSGKHMTPRPSHWYLLMLLTSRK